ncbi:MAG: undecaprenyl/decaprenyl-phosphate alpha-N-acetylglucosaminyl 1-phosphate transferase [Spirochaetaceae bacterium]|nr:MAG: undecaprenyl/decaprenyl-phosphate alpha-N-acetylglucosaminyl 1-phosphate transferase [Spirochaetaceae bacterium]
MTVGILALSVGIGAFVVNLALMPGIIAIARKKGWYDTRSKRKIHTTDIPRLGGVGLFVSFALTAAVGLLGMSAIEGNSVFARFAEYLPVLIGVSIMHVVGLVDDFKNLRAFRKLGIQLLAGAIVAISPYRLTGITIPFTEIAVRFGLFSYPLTIVWIVSLANAFNLIDGVDGLAGGVAAIAGAFMLAIGVITQQWALMVASAALIGATVGFLVFNLPPAKIFMGDSGSLFLGSVLAVIPLLTRDGVQSATNVVAILTLILIPVFDTIAAIVRRVRDGQPISQPDRKHLHHKLLDLNFGPWSVLAVGYGSCIALGSATVFWITAEPRVGATVLLAAWLLVLLGFIVLDRVQLYRSQPHPGDARTKGSRSHR